jgi:RNA-directed DNA polymerase
MYDVICGWENLRLAYGKAARGKRGHSAAAAFEYRLADNLLQLQTELLAQTYTPGPYTSFYIHDPKTRLISAAPFRDRVVHHALCNVIEPLFERSFIFDSYANRVGKGTHRALDRAQQFARRYRYVLQIDVEQFFPAIDHALMRRVLQRQIKDARTLWLVDQILASGAGVLAEEYAMRYFPGDDLFAAQRPRGLPIGNLTSQFWANCYLNPFDHFVQRDLRCPGYARYVDDALFFGNDRDVLQQWLEAVTARLARFRLTIHPGAQPHRTAGGFPFLGFVVYPDYRRMKRRKVVAYYRRVRQLLAQGASVAEVTASLQGWLNHARYGDTWHLRESVLAHVPPIQGGRFVERTVDDLYADV